ncbi:MAG: hypothetical protein LUE97_00200 [Oscillospiraceae bacterium]|nr:hypothetical protein [Oscillospiraceae bacterium]
MNKRVPRVEAVRMSADEMSIKPERFREIIPNATLGRYYTWLIYRDDPALPPISGLRIMNRDGFLSPLGMVRMGDTPLTHQTILPITNKTHGRGPAQYLPSETQESAKVYEAKGTDPDVLVQYADRWARIKESDIVDIQLDYTPYGLVVYPDCPFPGSAYLLQHLIGHGTIEGKEYKILGACDRLVGDFSPHRLKIPMVYFSSVGIREDGKVENACFTIVGDDRFMLYCVEGEKPIALPDFDAQLKWELVPYMPDKDTYTVTEATYRFADREIHYKAKWGFSGNCDEMQDVKGFSQSSGIWYTGPTEYKHEPDFSWVESWEATREQLEKFSLI